MPHAVSDFVSLPVCAALIATLTTVCVAFVYQIQMNLFRSLPKSIPAQTDPDEEPEPFMDPQWPHLVIVYEFLLLLVCFEHPCSFDTLSASQSIMWLCCPFTFLWILIPAICIYICVCVCVCARARARAV
jgi:hypothetical protein